MLEIMIVLLTVLALSLLIPADAFAWGGGIHLQLGSTVLSNLDAIRPEVAAIIARFPHDFLYGSIAADITVGKKFTHYLLHCHRWAMGKKVLARAETDSQKACAYGYLAHLAADSIAHNYYVPYKIMRTFSTLTMKHAYWEMRFEAFVDRDIWETARQVAQENYKLNDTLLRKVIADTIFSFGTNKRIFNSILLINRLEKWQKVLRTLSANSRYALAEEDRNEYMALAREAVFDVLNNLEDSRFLQADPTGERALKTADAVRRNLRLLYGSGKLTREQATGEIEEMKKVLRDSICTPKNLRQIHTGKRRLLGFGKLIG